MFLAADDRDLVFVGERDHFISIEDQGLAREAVAPADRAIGLVRRDGQLAASADAINKYTLGPGASLPSLSAAPGSDIARKLDTPIYRSFTTAIIPTLATPPFGPAFASASSAIMAGVQQAVTGSESIDDIAKSMQQQLDRR